MVQVWRQLILSSSFVMLMSTIVAARTLSVRDAKKDDDDIVLSPDFSDIAERGQSFSAGITEDSVEAMRRSITLPDNKRVESRSVNQGLSLVNLNPGSNQISPGDNLAMLVKRQAEEKKPTAVKKPKGKKGAKKSKSKKDKKKKSKYGKKKPKGKKPKGTKKKKDKKPKGKKKVKTSRGKAAKVKVTKNKKVKVTTDGGTNMTSNLLPKVKDSLSMNKTKEIILRNTTNISTANMTNISNQIINIENSSFPNAKLGQSGLRLSDQIFNTMRPKPSSDLYIPNRKPGFSMKSTHSLDSQSGRKITQGQSLNNSMQIGRVRAKSAHEYFYNRNSKKGKFFTNQNNLYPSTQNSIPGKVYANENNPYPSNQNIIPGNIYTNQNKLFQSSQNLNQKGMNRNQNNPYQTSKNFNQGNVYADQNNLNPSNKNYNQNVNQGKMYTNRHNLFQMTNNLNRNKVYTSHDNVYHPSKNLRPSKNIVYNSHGSHEYGKFTPAPRKVHYSNNNFENGKYNLPSVSAKVDSGIKQHQDNKLQWNNKKQWPYSNRNHKKQTVSPHLENYYSTGKFNEGTEDTVGYPRKDKYHDTLDEDEYSSWR